MLMKFTDAACRAITRKGGVVARDKRLGQIVIMPSGMQNRLWFEGRYDLGGDAALICEDLPDGSTLIKHTREV